MQACSQMQTKTIILKEAREISIRRVLGVTSPAELTRRVTGKFITLTKNGRSVSVYLADWNRLNINATI